MTCESTPEQPMGRECSGAQRLQCACYCAHNGATETIRDPTASWQLLTPHLLLSSLQPGFFMSLSPLCSLSTAAELQPTHIEIPQQHLPGSWILHLLSQAPFLECGLLDMSPLSISWLMSHLVGQETSLTMPVQLPGIRIKDNPRADRLLAWGLELLMVIHFECSFPVLYTPAGLLFSLSRLLRLSAVVLACPAQNWNSLQLQLLRSLSLPCIWPLGTYWAASKACCLSPFHPSVSIARPGWIPRIDTGDSHAWTKGYGICCCVDPCHQKKSQNLNEQRIFRTICKTSLCEMSPSKEKTTSCVLWWFPSFAFWNVSIKMSLGYVLCSSLLCQLCL